MVNTPDFPRLGRSAWKGDPQVFRSADFKRRCRDIVSAEGMDCLITYLFVFEHAGNHAGGEKPLNVFISHEDQSRFEKDPDEQRRLREVATELLG